MRILFNLWRMNLIPDSWMKCKVCGSGIIKTGYSKDFRQYYRCLKGHEDW